MLLIGGAFWFNSYRRAQRESDLQAAFAVVDAQVGPHNDYTKTFATQDEKNQASIKALTQVVTKDNGTREGLLAQYYLGTLLAQKGDMKGAEWNLKTVSSSSSDSAALAKIALAQLYISSNRNSEAEELLKILVNKPTDLVSKGQAQVLLAQLEASANPKEAKRILDGLKKPGESPAITRAADQLAAQAAK